MLINSHQDHPPKVIGSKAASSSKDLLHPDYPGAPWSLHCGISILCILWPHYVVSYAPLYMAWILLPSDLNSEHPLLSFVTSLVTFPPLIVVVITQYVFFECTCAWFVLLLVLPKCSRLREQSKFSDDIIILEDWLLAIDHYHHSSSQLARELRKLMILAKFQVLCITSITFLSPEMSSALTVMKTVPCSCVEAPLVRVAHSQ